MNHSPGEPLAPAPERGAGPNYYRYELELRRPLPMDDAGEANVGALEECADLLVTRREDELRALAKALARPQARAREEDASGAG